MSDTVYLGDDVDILFLAKDSKGRPLDLAGAVLYCDAQTGITPPVAASGFAIDNPATGDCRARFASGQTATFTPGATYLYDGRVKTADGKIHTIGTGSFRAQAAKTPTP